MIQYLNTAVQAARSASKIILDALERLDTISVYEKAPNNFVTSIDQAVEREIIGQISDAYPNHKFLSEESHAEEALNDQDSFWIIDPLDGTTNFMHGLPHFAISISYYEAGQVQCAVVYDPVANELFTAMKGKGARLNQQRLRVSKHKKLRGALLCTGFPCRKPEEQKFFVALINDLFKEVSGIRKTGSAALDLAYVAAGRFDALVDSDLKLWDTAAGSLLVTESGGILTDFSGNSDSANGIHSAEIMCANPSVYAAVSKVVAANKA
jgi:myo-inositol-1(or 4)-monophosphatase